MPLKLTPESASPRQPPVPGTPTYTMTLRDEAIARAIAVGYDRDKLLAYYELTPAGLNAILPRITGLVDRYRERLQLATQMNQTFIEVLAPKALNNIEQLMNDSTHKEWGMTNRWVVEQARGSKLAVEGGLSLAVTPQAISAIGEALTRLADAKAAFTIPVINIDSDPHLIPPEQQ